MSEVKKQKYMKNSSKMAETNYSERTLEIIMAQFKSENPALEAYSGFYPFDIYFKSNGLAVEINGPTHYYDMTDNLMPKYVLKKRLFQ